jgi:hypothetical protein
VELTVCSASQETHELNMKSILFSCFVYSINFIVPVASFSLNVNSYEVGPKLGHSESITDPHWISSEYH